MATKEIVCHRGLGRERGGLLREIANISGVWWGFSSRVCRKQIRCSMGLKVLCYEVAFKQSNIKREHTQTPILMCSQTVKSFLIGTISVRCHVDVGSFKYLDLKYFYKKTLAVLFFYFLNIMCLLR